MITGCDSAKKTIKLSNMEKRAYEFSINEELNTHIGLVSEETDLKGIDLQRQQLHQEVRDFLFNDLLEVGERYGGLVEPSVRMEALSALALHERGVPLVDMSKVHPTTIRSILRDLKKMKKLSEKGEMSQLDRDLFPQVRRILSREKSGKGAQLLLNMERLSDNIRQDTGKFSRKEEEIQTGINDWLFDKLENIRAKGRVRNDPFLIFDALMMGDGIYGIRNKDNKEVIIRKVDIQNDTITIEIPYYKETEPSLRVQVIKRKDIISELQLKEKRKKISPYLKAANESYLHLLQDLAHGRSRNIVFKDKIDKKHEKRVAEIIDQIGIDEENFTSYKFPYYYSMTQKGIRYDFAMIKESNVRGKEVYSAYLLRTVKKEKDRDLIDDDPTLPKGLFEDGFYHATESNITNTVFGDEKGDAETIREYDNFKYSHQPHEELIGPPPRKATGQKADPKSLWGALQKYRNILEEVFHDISGVTEQQSEYLERITKKLEKKYGKEQAKKVMEKITEALGWEHNIWFHKASQTIITPNSAMEHKDDNYFPVIFDQWEYWKAIDNAMLSLEDTIEGIEDTIEDAKEDTEQPKEVKRKYLKRLRKELKAKKELMKKWKSMQEDVNGENRDDVLSSRSSHAKERTMLMDYMLFRKDPGVLADYLNRTYSSLWHNRLKIDLLDTVVSIDPSDQMMDYFIDRFKIATMKPDTEAGIGPLRYDNERMADLFNRFKSKFKEDSSVSTAQSMSEFSITQNAIWTSLLLGFGGALRNQTQRANEIQRWGMGYTWQAFQEAKGEGAMSQEKIDDFIGKTGVENVISMFNDILLGSFGAEAGVGSSFFLDFGNISDWSWEDIVEYMGYEKASIFFPQGIQILGPGLMDYAKLRKLGKKRFMNKVSETEDEKSMLERLDRMFIYLLKRQKGRAGNNIRNLREAYYDILFETGGASREVMEKRMEILIGEGKKSVIRKAVSFKLSYFPFAKQWLTFSGGEQQMRREAAIAVVLMAKDAGFITGFQDPRAIQMARISVYSTMFGMSQAYLPGMFGGLGRSYFQYKPYSYHQTVNDWRALRNFHKGGRFIGHNFYRLINAAWYFTEGVTGIRKLRRDDKKNFSLGNRNLDHEALMAVRTVLLRLAGSVTGIFFSSFPAIATMLGGNIIGGIFGKFKRGKAGSMVRGMENPVLGLISRSFLYMFIYGAALDDDEEGLEPWQREAIMLMLPPILYLFTRLMYAGTKGERM